MNIPKMQIEQDAVVNLSDGQMGIQMLTQNGYNERAGEVMVVFPGISGTHRMIAGDTQAAAGSGWGNKMESFFLPQTRIVSLGYPTGGDVTTEGYAESAHEALRRLDIAPDHVLGISCGGPVAAHLSALLVQNNKAPKTLSTIISGVNPTPFALARYQIILQIDQVLGKGNEERDSVVQKSLGLYDKFFSWGKNAFDEHFFEGREGDSYGADDVEIVGTDNNMDPNDPMIMAISYVRKEVADLISFTGDNGELQKKLLSLYYQIGLLTYCTSEKISRIYPREQQDQAQAIESWMQSCGKKIGALSYEDYMRRIQAFSHFNSDIFAGLSDVRVRAFLSQYDRLVSPNTIGRQIGKKDTSLFLDPEQIGHDAPFHTSTHQKRGRGSLQSLFEKHIRGGD